jgi:hypothetical protein
VAGYAGAAFKPLDGMTAPVSVTIEVWWGMDARSAKGWVSLVRTESGASQVDVAGHAALVFHSKETKYGGSEGIGVIVDHPISSDQHLQIRIQVSSTRLANPAGTEAATLAFAQKAVPVVFRAAGQ